ncbi:transcriptional regulator, partial [Shigella sonnei]|nr:transcriptional regulator [Shigella sonnei]EFV5870510.1 transcriptional regulator [Shigella sonnei]EFX3948108.1 transcriptional regulator [Shigella sonnei]
MYWIINDNIEFWPEHRKLISVHNADLNVVLTTPASRCLSLLLEAFPDVVAQQDFFTIVWEEEGMRVPTNTLYQNISIIRRGFRAVGDTTHSLIATVPREDS